MTDYNAHKQDYDQHGYTIVREFLNQSELSELQENLDRYIREIVPTLPDADAFYEDRDRPETLKQLQHMGSDPYFLSTVSTPNGKPCRKL
ncbi:MAG: hypothetical protein GXP30_04295 [Verrucomicrobia bacterium]|nr:hypothetical protein [Verrucomicrobiota bacterium]